MKVADLMTRHVEFIGPDDSVRVAAELMGELDVGALPVGSPEALRGVLTDRDILFRVVAEGRDPDSVQVRDVASSPVIACGEDEPLAAAMDLMAAHQVRRLAVRDPAGRAVGWITLSDLARNLLVNDPAVQGALRNLTDDQAR